MEAGKATPSWKILSASAQDIVVVIQDAIRDDAILIEQKHEAEEVCMAKLASSRDQNVQKIIVPK